MKNKTTVEHKNKLNVLRWVTLLPLAFVVQALGSLLLATPFILLGVENQVFLDGLSAFIGSFLLILTFGLLAPSKRIKVANIIFWIIVSLASISFILGVLGVYELVEMETPDKIIPVLQILGSLYAITLIPTLVTRGFTLDMLLGKIAGLGGTTTITGGLVSLLGLVIGLITTSWGLLSVGLTLFVVGMVTWMIPYISIYVSLLLGQNKAERIINELKKNENDKRN